MAANLNKTKRRISSVNSTKKITKAMELVATVKLKRFKSIMEKNNLFTDEIVNLINSLLERSEGEEAKVYLEEKEADKDLVVVVNSNLGLCAGFNNDIYKFISANIDKNTAKLIPIGLKGDNYYKRENYEVDSSFVQLNEKIVYEDVVKLSSKISDDFINSKYRSVKLVYTKYVNSIKFAPTMVTLFPLNKKEGNDLGYAPEFDPDIKTLIKELVPLYISSFLYQRIIESQVSEQASRRTAMENATDNADELIKQLTLEFNKARQAAITQEITEVVAGQKQ